MEEDERMDERIPKLSFFEVVPLKTDVLTIPAYINEGTADQVAYMCSNAMRVPIGIIFPQLNYLLETQFLF